MPLLALIFRPIAWFSQAGKGVFGKAGRTLDKTLFQPAEWLYNNSYPSFVLLRPLTIWTQLPFNCWRMTVRPRLEKTRDEKRSDDKRALWVARECNNPSYYKPKMLKHKLVFWWHRNLAEGRKALGLPHDLLPDTVTGRSRGERRLEGLGPYEPLPRNGEHTEYYYRLK